MKYFIIIKTRFYAISGQIQALFPFVFVSSEAIDVVKPPSSIIGEDSDEDVFLPQSPHKITPSRPGSGRSLIPSIGQSKVCFV